MIGKTLEDRKPSFIDADVIRVGCGDVLDFVDVIDFLEVGPQAGADGEQILLQVRLVDISLPRQLLQA